MMIKSSDRTSVHAGHLYVNGVHWLYKCPKCVAMMAMADQIAKEDDNGKSEN